MIKPNMQVPGRKGAECYGDPSDKIWSIYVKEAARFDKVLVNDWKSSMDGILIFAGLFSAVVTSFIIESYASLSQDPNDTIIALLSQISMQLSAMSNGSQPIEIPQPFVQNSFKPTVSALSANALWFLSLTFSLGCALAAILVQQWARSFTHSVGRHQAPHKRGKIRAFLYEGLERFGMAAVVEAIPTLLHISLFLFLAGLFVFLLPTNVVIAYIILAIWVCCTILYAATTILPVFYLNYPYQTPVSASLWRVMQAFHLQKHPEFRSFIAGKPSRESLADFRNIAALGDWVNAYDARQLKAIRWTFESVNEDHELQRFVEGIPGFISSSTGIITMRELMKDGKIANGIGVLLEISNGLSTSALRIKCIKASMNAMWHMMDARLAIGDQNLLRWCSLTANYIMHESPFISFLALCTTARTFAAVFGGHDDIIGLHLPSLITKLESRHAYELVTPSELHDQRNMRHIRPFDAVIRFLSISVSSTEKKTVELTVVVDIFKLMIAESAPQECFVTCLGRVVEFVLAEDRDIHDCFRDILRAAASLDDSSAIEKAKDIITRYCTNASPARVSGVACVVSKVLQSKSERNQSGVRQQPTRRRTKG